MIEGTFVFFINDPEYGCRQITGSFDYVGAQILKEIVAGRIRRKDGLSFSNLELVNRIGSVAVMPSGMYLDVQENRYHTSRDTKEWYWYIAKY